MQYKFMLTTSFQSPDRSDAVRGHGSLSPSPTLWSLCSAIARPNWFDGVPGARPGVLGPLNNAVEADSAQEFSEQVAFSVADIHCLPFVAEYTAYTA